MMSEIGMTPIGMAARHPLHEMTTVFWEDCELETGENFKRTNGEYIYETSQNGIYPGLCKFMTMRVSLGSLFKISCTLVSA
jgi:hypothetical protein